MERNLAYICLATLLVSVAVLLASLTVLLVVAFREPEPIPVLISGPSVQPGVGNQGAGGSVQQPGAGVADPINQPQPGPVGNQPGQPGPVSNPIGQPGMPGEPDVNQPGSQN